MAAKIPDHVKASTEAMAQRMTLERGNPCAAKAYFDKKMAVYFIAPATDKFDKERYEEVYHFQATKRASEEEEFDLY
jgi:hypothetical protein